MVEFAKSVVQSGLGIRVSRNANLHFENAGKSLPIAESFEEPAQRAQGSAVLGFNFENRLVARDRGIDVLKAFFLDVGNLKQQFDLPRRVFSHRYALAENRQ